MVKIGELLKTRGKKIRIEEQDEKINQGKKENAEIRMYFNISEEHYISRWNEYPSVSFMPIKSTKKINIGECTMSPGRGGHSGSTGEYSLNEITSDLVEEKVLKVLREIYD